ncbi:MAG TPA: hypothetical protein VFM18_08330 [Methanosarcina sp.]|nr:hypothetical protein [Methanosarcina sp.]
MPNFTREEAIAFNADLNRYMAQETAADYRAAWVEDRVNQLMKEGEEYDPFTPDHVQEAISELSVADAILLGSYVSTSFKLPDNDTARINLADFVTDRVQDYWHKMAVWQAENEYDKKEF